MSSEALSVRAFAKTLGVSHVAVLKAIERGRLRLSVRVNPRGHAEIHNVELAKREWADNAGKTPKVSTSAAPSVAPAAAVTGPVTTVTSLPPIDDGLLPIGEGRLTADTLAEAQMLAALELARQRRLANQLREEQLVPAAAVKKLRFEAERALRENLLNIPARISGSLAAESDVSKVYLLLDEAIREALRATGAAYRAAAAVERGQSEAEAVVHG